MWIPAHFFMCAVEMAGPGKTNSQEKHPLHEGEMFPENWMKSVALQEW